MILSMPRNVVLLMLIIFSATTLYGCTAEVTDPVAGANLYLDPTKEPLLVRSMQNFANKEGLRLLGTATQIDTHPDRRVFLRLNLSIYRDDSLVVSVSGGNTGEYRAFGYARWDPSWKSVWDKLLLYLRASLGDAIRIESLEIPTKIVNGRQR